MVWIITCPECEYEGTADDFDMEKPEEECQCPECWKLFIADLDSSEDDET